jgi:hypothetical protein
MEEIRMRTHLLPTSSILTWILLAIHVTSGISRARDLDDHWVWLHGHPGPEDHAVKGLEYTYDHTISGPIGHFRVVNLDTGLSVPLEGEFGKTLHGGGFNGAGTEVAVGDYVERRSPEFRCRIFSATTGKFLRDSPVSWAHLSSDFGMAALLDTERDMIVLADITTTPPRTVMEFPLKYNDYSRWPEFSRGGQTMLVNESRREYSVYDLSKSPPERILTTSRTFFGDSIEPILSHSGRLVAYQESLGEAAVYDLDQDKELFRFPLLKHLELLRFNQLGSSTELIVNNAGSYRYYDAVSGKLLK